MLNRRTILKSLAALPLLKFLPALPKKKTINSIGKPTILFTGDPHFANRGWEIHSINIVELPTNPDCVFMGGEVV